MSKLTDKLLAAGEENRGTELGGLLQWAALHIQSQDEALDELFAAHGAERQRLDAVAHEVKAAIESVLDIIYTPLCQPIELGRDYMPNNMSTRHVDCREPRKRKTT